MDSQINKQITPRFGQDVNNIRDYWVGHLTNKVEPAGVVPKISENTRRIAITKGSSVVEISIGG